MISENSHSCFERVDFGYQLKSEYVQALTRLVAARTVFLKGNIEVSKVMANHATGECSYGVSIGNYHISMKPIYGAFGNFPDIKKCLGATVFKVTYMHDSTHPRVFDDIYCITNNGPGGFAQVEKIFGSAFEILKHEADKNIRFGIAV